MKSKNKRPGDVKSAELKGLPVGENRKIPKQEANETEPNPQSGKQE